MKDINPDFDIIVVGGGAAGSAAASVLVKKGLKIAMIDGGNMKTSTLIDPELDFETTRKYQSDQYKIFLGENLSGLNLSGKSHSQNQSSGNKEYLIQDVQAHLPVKNKNVEILQTLAKGGLTEIWGANCDFFTPSELTEIGLPVASIQKQYQSVINDIGVSGISKEFKLQPAANIDHNARKLLSTYKKRKNNFDDLSLEIHQPYLALLTKTMKGRQATNYNDMDYWSDYGKSVYKASLAIDKLKNKSNFNYIKEIAVEIQESNNQIRVITEKSSFTAKYIILAAGPLGTARILLRSFNLYNTHLPFLTKFHILSPNLLLSNIGKQGDIKKHSFCQLIMASKNENIKNYTYTQFYSYKSLLLYKLLSYSKLPIPEALKILSLISSALVIADTRFGSSSNEAGNLFLQKNKNEKDVLNITMKKPDEEQIKNSEQFKKVKKGIKNLGLFSLKSVFMPYGSTAHYSGTLGKKTGLNKSLKVDTDGKLERSNNIFIADSSVWEALPAKPPTLTIMAGAQRVAQLLIDRF